MQEDEGNENHQFFFEKIKKGKELKHLGMSWEEINRSFPLEEPITVLEKETAEDGGVGRFIKTNRKAKTSISEITLLNAAIYYWNIVAIKKLLEKGADPTVTTTVRKYKQYETVGRDVPHWDKGWKNGGSSTQNLNAEEFFEKFMKDKCEADEGAEILNLIKEKVGALRATM
jgi:hypothetical protein